MGNGEWGMGEETSLVPTPHSPLPTPYRIMADKLNLEVITPERLVLREQVDEVVAPGLGGELGILPDHTPLISQLKTGVLSYRQGNENRRIHVSGGFVEVGYDHVSVLSIVACKTVEIDVERGAYTKEVVE